MGHLSQERIDSFIKHAESKSFPILIETGTHIGNVWKRFCYKFEKILTVEVKQDFYDMNKKEAPENVECFLGDTSEKLPLMISSVPADKNIIFWLDAHYSNGYNNHRTGPDCPLYIEASIIDNTFAGKEAIVIMDDTQAFGIKTDDIDWRDISFDNIKKKFIKHEITYSQFDQEMCCIIIKKP